MRHSIKLAIFLRFPWDLWTLWWSLSWYLIKLSLWFSHSSRLNESKNDTQPNCRNVPFPSSCFNLDHYTINSSYIAFRYKFVNVTEISVVFAELFISVLLMLDMDLFHSHQKSSDFFYLNVAPFFRPFVRPSFSNAWSQNWLISFFIFFFIKLDSHKVRKVTEPDLFTKVPWNQEDPKSPRK